MEKTVLVRLAIVALAFPALVACGGGGGNGGSGGDDGEVGLTLVRMEFLDRSHVPLDPAPTQDLPRNALLRFVFSDPVDPDTVTTETIQVRYSPGYVSVALGSFQVDGTEVIFDPTVTAQGVPNPLGFQAYMRYRVVVPSLLEQSAVVRGEDDAPHQPRWSAELMTDDGWLAESDPPELQQVFWIPEQSAPSDPVPPSSILGLVFSEPMDPASFVLGTSPAPPDPGATVEVRYTYDPACQLAGVAGLPITGSISPDTALGVFYFRPDVTFGDGLPFRVDVTAVRDLAGIPLVNAPQRMTVLCEDDPANLLRVEDFADQTDLDATATSADWGASEPGFLLGRPSETAIAQSLFLPNPGSQVAIVPSHQANGSLVTLEFQGADAVEADRAAIDPSAPYTDWEEDPAACAGRTFIRFRIMMVPDPVIQEGARIDFVALW